MQCFHWTNNMSVSRLGCLPLEGQGSGTHCFAFPRFQDYTPWPRALPAIFKASSSTASPSLCLLPPSTAPLPSASLSGHWRIIQDHLFLKIFNLAQVCKVPFATSGANHRFQGIRICLWEPLFSLSQWLWTWNYGLNFNPNSITYWLYELQQIEYSQIFFRFIKWTYK